MVITSWSFPHRIATATEHLPQPQALCVCKQGICLDASHHSSWRQKGLNVRNCQKCFPNNNKSQQNKKNKTEVCWCSHTFLFNGSPEEHVWKRHKGRKPLDSQSIKGDNMRISIHPTGADFIHGALHSHLKDALSTEASIAHFEKQAKWRTLLGLSHKGLPDSHPEYCYHQAAESAIYTHNKDG